MMTNCNITHQTTILLSKDKITFKMAYFTQKMVSLYLTEPSFLRPAAQLRMFSFVLKDIKVLRVVVVARNEYRTRKYKSE